MCLQVNALDISSKLRWTPMLFNEVGMDSLEGEGERSSIIFSILTSLSSNRVYPTAISISARSTICKRWQPRKWAAFR